MNHFFNSMDDEDDCKIFINEPQFRKGLDESHNQSVVETTKIILPTQAHESADKGKASNTSFIRRNTLAGTANRPVQYFRDSKTGGTDLQQRIGDLERQVFQLQSERTALEQSIKCIQDELI